MGSSTSKIQPELTLRTLTEGFPDVLDVDLSVFERSIELKAADRVFFVDMPWGYRCPIVFHDGPTTDFPVMAIAVDPNKLGMKYKVDLPAVPSENFQPSTRMLKRDLGMLIAGQKYWFEIEVGLDLKRRTERFEWRRSRGKEVRGSDIFRRGWKLVRMNGTGSRPADLEGYARDGGEIVAVWTSHLGITDMGRFQFLGSGLDGLGEAFKLMAIVTCVAVRVNQLRQNQ